MPVKKDDDKEMDAELKAKRSGPAPSGDAMPKPLADPDAGFEDSDARPEREGEVPNPVTVEQKLQDPTFDPEGHERLRLAEESRRTGSGRPYPPSTSVDERGDPMEPGERNPERTA